MHLTEVFTYAWSFIDASVCQNEQLMQINVAEKTQIEGDLLHNAESIIVKFKFYAHNLQNTTWVAINLCVSSGRGTEEKINKKLPAPELLLNMFLFFKSLPASVLQVISTHLLIFQNVCQVGKAHSCYPTHKASFIKKCPSIHSLVQTDFAQVSHVRSILEIGACRATFRMHTSLYAKIKLLYTSYAYIRYEPYVFFLTWHRCWAFM